MDDQDSQDFTLDFLKKYPHGERKLSIEIGQYCISVNSTKPLQQRQKALTTFISPHGMEIQGNKDYPKGTLLKISISIPDYWKRKKKFVNYNRIDAPEDFKVLAKVVDSQEIGKRGKKRLLLLKTVNIDEVDERVLSSYLEEK